MGPVFDSKRWRLLRIVCFNGLVDLPVLALAVDNVEGRIDGLYKTLRKIHDRVHQDGEKGVSAGLPNTAMKGVYEEKYERYKKVISALDPIWKDIS